MGWDTFVSCRKCSYNLRHILKIDFKEYRKYERPTSELDLDLDWDRELNENENYYRYQQEHSLICLMLD